MTAFVKASRLPIILVLLTVFLGTMITMNNLTKARAAKYAPTVRDVQVMMARLGLDAERLAAAGVTTTQAGRIAQNVLSATMNNQGQLLLNDQVVAEARGANDRLQRLVRSGQADEKGYSDSRAAKTQLQLSENQRDAFLGTMRSSATAHLSDKQRSILATIRGNEQWNLPLEFLVVARTEAEYVQLRSALAHERIAAKGEEEIIAEVNANLVEARSDNAVSSAKASIDANADAIETSCLLAISG